MFDVDRSRMGSDVVVFVNEHEVYGERVVIKMTATGMMIIEHGLLRDGPNRTPGLLVLRVSASSPGLYARVVKGEMDRARSRAAKARSL